MVRIEKNPKKDMKLSECKVHDQQCQAMITNVLARICTSPYLDGNENDSPRWMEMRKIVQGEI